jgi:hypothetical protein
MRKGLILPLWVENMGMRILSGPLGSWEKLNLGKAEPPVPWPQGPAAATGCQPQREPDPDRVEAGKSFQLKTTLMVR